MKKYYPIYILALCVLCLSSCSRLKQVGFWDQYQRAYAIFKEYNQGPWGGHTAIQWEHKDSAYFTCKNAIEFAQKHEWVLIDSARYPAVVVQKWVYDRKAIFPLSNSGFDPAMQEPSTTFSNFPRNIESEVCVYAFSSGWLSIKPGTDETEERNGFILISADGKKMAVYHLWGE